MAWCVLRETCYIQHTARYMLHVPHTGPLVLPSDTHSSLEHQSVPQAVVQYMYESKTIWIKQVLPTKQDASLEDHSTRFSLTARKQFDGLCKLLTLTLKQTNQMIVYFEKYVTWCIWHVSRADMQRAYELARMYFLPRRNKHKKCMKLAEKCLEIAQNALNQCKKIF